MLIAHSPRQANQIVFGPGWIAQLEVGTKRHEYVDSVIDGLECHFINVLYCPLYGSVYVWCAWENYYVGKNLNIDTTHFFCHF